MAGTTTRPRSSRESAIRLTGRAVPHVVLLIACFLSVAPFIWSFFGSLKPFRELVSSKELLPQVWTLSAYEEILGRINITDAFKNSLVVAIIVMASSLFTSSALGYVFAKYKFPGKDLLFILIVATLMVPFIVLLVPLYITIADAGLVNQLSGVIVTGLWTSLGIFMMRQFMDSIPSELIDAARIDGAGEWYIYRRIILPLSGAPLAALAVLIFLGSWDNFLWPTTVLTSPENQTVPLLLSGLRSLHFGRYDLWSAGSMLTVIPVMIVYLFASRFFIRGVAMTGLKG
jgi:multiple sugar transport system permease protein